jgi:hypothetical protein
VATNNARKWSPRSQERKEKTIGLGAFNTLELTGMHASCLLPGIAGPVMNLDTRAKGKKSARSMF